MAAGGADSCRLFIIDIFVFEVGKRKKKIFVSLVHVSIRR